MEYIHDRTTGYSFALVIFHGREGAENKLRIDLAKQCFYIDDKTFQAADVKGQLMIWQDGQHRVIQMPDGFTYEEARRKVAEMLDELNAEQPDSK